MRNLSIRLVSAAVLIALVVITILVRGWFAWSVVSIFGLAAAWELARMFAKAGHPVNPVILYPVTLVLVLRAVLPGELPIVEWCCIFSVIVGLGMMVFERSTPFGWLSALGISAYVGLGLGYVLLLLDRAPRSDPHLGMLLVIVMLAGIVACDTGAYAVGIPLGRHRLIPDISPKKSIEGAVGGLLAACIVGIVCGMWLLNLSVLASAVLGMMIGILAQIGDLAESALKRQADMKDSSGLIPGHGGVMDRFDSILFVVPVVYWYLQAVLRIRP